MKIESIFEDNRTIYDEIRYEDGVFILTGEDAGEVIIESTLKYDVDTDITKFEVYIVHNNISSENNIYRLKKRDENVGFVFPVYSAISDSHDYAEDKIFLRYAYASILNYFSSLEKKVAVNLEEGNAFDKLFEGDENFLVFFKEDINDSNLFPGGFQLEDYYPCLLENGYSIIPNKYMSPLLPSGKNIKLKACSKEIEYKEYIVLLFKILIPQTKDELARFHMLYQVIEALIDNVFRIEFKEFIYNLSQNNETTYLSEEKEKLSELTSEKTRIRKLFGNYSSIESTKRESLNDICTRILSKASCENDISLELSDKLYKVRCLLVHNLYKIKNDNQDLEELNNCFLEVLVDIVTSFKH